MTLPSSFMRRTASIVLASILASFLSISTSPVQPALADPACADPTFVRREIASGLSTPSDAYPVDLDEDGNIDIVATVRNADRIIRYMGDGAGNFSATNLYSGSSQTPWTVAAGDLDDDGDVDVVSGDDSSGIYARFNNGSETFSSQLLQNGSAYAVKIVDLDEDGNHDVVASRQAGGTNSITWYRRTSGTTFTTNIVGTGGTFMMGMDVADIDGDTDLDIVGASWSARTIRKLVNDGSENFSWNTFYTGTGNTFMSDFADIDGDTDLDFASADAASDGTVKWFRNNGSGVFTRIDILDPTNTPSDVDAVDLDNDGDVDVVSLEEGDLVLYANDGSENFTRTVIATDAGYSTDYMHHEYVDGDGLTDLVFASNDDNTVAWYEHVCDSTPPTVSGLSPADNATGVSTTANLVITFNENVSKEGTGNITIKKTSDDSTVETIPVTGSRVTGSGTSVITVNPSTTLDESTSYYVLIASTAFSDAAGNDYAGIASTTAWNFTTGDFTAPSLSSFSPGDESTNVIIGTDLKLTFSEAVQGGTGSVVIRRSSDDGTVRSIVTNTSAVTGSGTATITIDLPSDLEGNTSYYVTVGKNAFQDASGNDYAGFTSSSTWNFATEVRTGSNSNVQGGGGGGRRSTAGQTRSESSQGQASSSAPLADFPSCPDVTVPAPARSQGGKLLTSVDGKDTVFADVTIGAWFSSFVDDLIKKGILSGYKDASGKPTGFYGPSNGVTVAEVLKMALEAFDETPTSTAAPSHPDAAGHWSAPYVARAEQTGLADLLGKNLDAPATRGLAIAIFAKAAGLPIPKISALPYSDVGLGDDHVAAIAAATNACWVRGDTDSSGKPVRTFRADDVLNRAEAAKVLSIILRTR